MRILFITYSYNNSFPAGTASSRIADALADCGSEVCVISSENVGNKFQRGNHIICSSFPNRPSRLFLKIGRLIKREIIYEFWERRAYSAAIDVINNWRPDAIYSRATPVAVCSVAARLSSKYHIPTIMHFTDPWPSPIEWMPNVIDRMIYTKWMNSILPFANLVSFGNQRMLEYQQKSINYQFTDKAFVSPDPSPDVDFSYSQKLVGATIRLVFLGKIHGSRNPKPLFEAVNLLNQKGRNVELIICEKNNGNQEENNFIKFIGRTSNVNQLLLSSDILVDIDGYDKDPVFISSKFKDYINYGRPILSITPNNSPIRELVNGMNTILCVQNDSDNIQSAISFLSQTEFQRKDYFERNDLISMFKPKFIAADLLRRIELMITSNC